MSNATRPAPQGLIEIRGGSPNGMTTIGWVDTYDQARDIARKHIRLTQTAIEVIWRGGGEASEDFKAGFGTLHEKRA